VFACIHSKQIIGNSKARRNKNTLIFLFAKEKLGPN
jgi:hypothetical protein